MMNDKELDIVKLDDNELENVVGGVGGKLCGVDGGAVRRPKEELDKIIGSHYTEYNQKGL